jgi:L-cysteine/cystine lyase
MAYLNTGTSGPLALCVVEAIEHALRRELALGRTSPSGLPDYAPLVQDTRRRLAALIGADVDEIALTDSTTHGVNAAVWGLPWRAEDEVLTSTVEHPGIVLPLHHLARRTGVSLRTVAPEAVPFAITDHTRLVAVSHVSFSTGGVLPIAEIASAARESGALLLVDGAQAVGAMPVDVHALDVDFYAFAGQKWLCGPEGTGALYVRPGIAAQPTHVSTHSVRPSGAGGRDPRNVSLADTARRFESSAVFRPALHGLHAALRWLTDDIGLDVVFDRTRALARYCHDRLSALPGAEVLAPREAMAGLVCFRLPSAPTVAALQERGLTIRRIPETDALRASCAFFNTWAEIDRLADVLVGEGA